MKVVKKSCWKQNHYIPGTPVRVFDVDRNDLGTGELLTEYHTEMEDNEMPRIRLTDGRIIHGYECWWIPVKEIE